MLFCSNSTRNSHFSIIQLCDGMTDGRTDGPTDGRNLLSGSENVSKKELPCSSPVFIHVRKFGIKNSFPSLAWVVRESLYSFIVVREYLCPDFERDLYSKKEIFSRNINFASKYKRKKIVRMMIFAFPLFSFFLTVVRPPQCLIRPRCAEKKEIFFFTRGRNRKRLLLQQQQNKRRRRQ